MQIALNRRDSRHRYIQLGRSPSDAHQRTLRIDPFHEESTGLQVNRFCHVESEKWWIFKINYQTQLKLGEQIQDEQRNSREQNIEWFSLEGTLKII